MCAGYLHYRSMSGIQAIHEVRRLAQCELDQGPVASGEDQLYKKSPTLTTQGRQRCHSPKVISRKGASSATCGYPSGRGES